MKSNYVIQVPFKLWKKGEKQLFAVLNGILFILCLVGLYEVAVENYGWGAILMFVPMALILIISQAFIDHTSIKI